MRAWTAFEDKGILLLYVVPAELNGEENDWYLIYRRRRSTPPILAQE